MKQCECGSYAINIERLTGENCDVTRREQEKLKAALEKLKKEKIDFGGML